MPIASGKEGGSMLSYKLGKTVAGQVIKNKNKAGKIAKAASNIVNEISSINKEEIRKAFKRANQRIAEIAKQFADMGGTESAVYKNEVAKFQKGAYAPYMGESASGNVKFDIPKIIHAYETGELSESEFNEILSAASGHQYDSQTGELTERGKGISTITDIKERTLPNTPEDFDEYTEDWKEFAEDNAQIAQNFQTEYEEFKKKYKTVSKRMKAAPGLYTEGKKTYEDLRGLSRDIKEAVKLFDDEKKKAKTANDKLKEPRKTKRKGSNELK